jgi:hypothetical protein
MTANLREWARTSADSLAITSNPRQHIMRQSTPQHHPPSLNRIVAYNGGGEWADMPTLSDTVAQRLLDEARNRQLTAQFNSAWDNTAPADLDALPPPEPFQETLSGLVQREVHEPDVFRHFFGARTPA